MDKTIERYSRGRVGDDERALFVLSRRRAHKAHQAPMNETNQPPPKWGLWLGDELIATGETEPEAANNAIKAMIADGRIENAYEFWALKNSFLLKPLNPS